MNDDCTCHPYDNPPRPCPQKYALGECRLADAEARADAALALVAEAYEVAANLSYEVFNDPDALASAIRALTPSDALAALEARDKRVRDEALREGRGVSVKPLEWRPTFHSFEAKSIMGKYQVYPSDRSEYWLWRGESGRFLDQYKGKEPGPEAAKAAAQADYERRILSTLFPAPVSVRAAAKVLLCDQDAMSAMCRAAAGSRAHDDEGEFEPLMDLIVFRGENKTRAVIFAAIYDALRALSETEGE